jgi:hypothetical protein
MIYMTTMVGSLLALSAAPTASAAPGDHIGSDTVSLIPRIDLSTQYRTNVYLEEGDIGGGTPETSAALLMISPSAIFKVDGENVNLNFNGTYGMRRYINEDVSNLNRFKDGKLELRTLFLPDAKVGLVLNDTFVSSGRETDSFKAESAYIQQLSNELKSGLQIQPGSALDISVLGVLNIEDYSGITPVGAEADTLNNKYEYGVLPSIVWSFFPKTKFFVQGDYRWFDWYYNEIDVNESIAPECIGTEICVVGIPNGSQSRVSAGINGRFTDKTSLILSVGKGKSTYDETSVEGGSPDDSFAADLDSLLIYQARFEVYPSEFQTIYLNFKTDFKDVYFSNFSEFKSLDVGYNGNLTSKVSLKTSFELRQDNYEGIISRSDIRLNARGDFDIRVADFMNVTFGTWWRRLASQDGISAIEYDDVNVHAGVAFTY